MGFQIQEIYALLFLVDTKYRNYKKIEIETFDDVCIKGNNKIICQIKRKSTEKVGITNASEELWKTIYNWLFFIKQNIVDDNDVLMFVLDCKQENSAEKFIYKMSIVSSDNESKVLYDHLKDWYTKNYIEQDSQAKIRRYLDVIFKEENEYYIKEIFIKFSLINNKENYFDKMKNILENEYVYPKVLIDGLVDRIISWFKQIIIERYPISVDRIEFNEVIKHYIEQRSMGAKLISLNADVNEDDIERKRIENPIFIQELLKLNVEDTDIVDAVKYFIQTNHNRQHYVLTNQIIDDDLYEFDQHLIFQWKNHRNEVKISKDDVLTKSNKLWISCLKDEFKLNNMELPYYFTYGSYNILVNNENIHWYLKELDE